jgi:hypothetical protein
MARIEIKADNVSMAAKVKVDPITGPEGPRGGIEV